MEKLLKNLLETASPSRYEENIQKVIRDYTSKFSTTSTDNVYNLYSTLEVKDSTNRILMTAHCDEIGLMISHINGNGTCRVVKVGGIKPELYVGVKVNIITQDNKIVNGVMGIKNGTFNGKVDESSLFIDLGVDSKEEALKLVSVGDEVILATTYQELANNRLSARALDDRIGCFIITKVLENLSNQETLNNTVCSCTTTGEETGLRGAYHAASKFKPNIAIAVDVTYTTDITGDSGATGDVSLGNGPVICHSSIVHKKLNNLLKTCAANLDIPLQNEISVRQTGTDADKMHYTNEGVPVCLLSIPLRYMHSSAEVCDMNDVNNAILLLTEFINKINDKLDLSTI